MSVWITEVEPAGRRAAAGRQGPLRHRGGADDLRLADLRRPRARGDGPRRHRARGRRLRRCVGKANLHEFAWGITSENEHFGWVPNPRRRGSHAGRLERRQRGGAGRSARPTRRWVPTRAARSGSRRRAAASPGSSRPTGSSRSRAAGRWRRASTTPGRWPVDVGGLRADAPAPGSRASRRPPGAGARRPARRRGVAGGGRAAASPRASRRRPRGSARPSPSSSRSPTAPIRSSPARPPRCTARSTPPSAADYSENLRGQARHRAC